MNQLKATLSIDTQKMRDELNELEKQADSIIKKIKFIKNEQKGGN